MNVLEAFDEAHIRAVALFYERVAAERVAEKLHEALEVDAELYAEHVKRTAEQKHPWCNYGKCRPTDIFGG